MGLKIQKRGLKYVHALLLFMKKNTEAQNKAATRKRKEYMHEYYESHYKQFKDSCAKRYEKHKDEVKASAKQYYYANRERILELRKTEYKKKRQAKIDYVVQWQKDNPKKVAARWHKRRLREQTNGGSFTVEEIDQLFDMQNGCCYYCGKLLYASFDMSIHIDHKTPVSRGGTNDIDNLALACAYCNLSKFTKTAEEYIGSM